MRWQKLGRVFEADGQRPWMISHTQNPVAELVQSDVFRVYFTCRDAKNRSHVGWLEIDLSRPNEVLNLAENPLLAPGPSGMFDDAGAMTASVVRHESRRYFYYTGWSNRADTRPSIVRENGGYVMWYAVRGHDARYRPGRAVSADGLTWTREDDRTGLDLSSEGWDSEMIAYPHVFNHHGIQYMLYCGNDYGRSGLGLAVRA